MTNEEKIKILKRMKPELMNVYGVTQTFQNTGDYKDNYEDYMKSSTSINVDDELQRLDTADYDLACAIFTAVLREGYFCGEKMFQKRVKRGEVNAIIQRMITLLEA